MELKAKLDSASEITSALEITSPYDDVQFKLKGSFRAEGSGGAPPF